jgi:[ribosomal protein S18]-alanine N-acetyltransferase
MADKPSETIAEHARLRRMCESDLIDVLTVERSAYEFPWSEQVFRDCLRVGYSCWIATSPAPNAAQAYGFAVMSMAAGEAHILNLCIAPNLQGHGLGRKTLSHLCGVAATSGVQRMLLEVRPSNPAAIGLYDGAGFARIGTRKGYYPAGAGREDAIVMAYDVGAAKSSVVSS